MEQFFQVALFVVSAIAFVCASFFVIAKYTIIDRLESSEGIFGALFGVVFGLLKAIFKIDFEVLTYVASGIAVLFGAVAALVGVFVLESDFTTYVYVDGGALVFGGVLGWIAGFLSPVNRLADAEAAITKNIVHEVRAQNAKPVDAEVTDSADAADAETTEAQV